MVILSRMVNDLGGTSVPNGEFVTVGEWSRRNTPMLTSEFVSVGE